MILLTYCSVCKKPKLNVKLVAIQNANGVEVRGNVCLTCLGSSEEIIKAIKKLSTKDREEVSEYILTKCLKFK